MLTDEGIRHAEKLLGVANLYDPNAIETLHGLNQALLAHNLYKRDVDYMVRPKEDGRGQEIVIVDEFTGRMMPGRRWSNGLHQAIEAKEGVEVNAENQTLATVTFQNFFRMYKKLAGMTGTAETEARELPADLQAGSGHRAHQHAHGPQGLRGRGLRHQEGQDEGHRRGDQGAARARASPSSWAPPASSPARTSARS